jgi:hypothetical protein
MESSPVVARQPLHAGNPIGWVIPEEFGALGGRWHCHA